MGFKKLEEFKDYLKINNVDYNFLKNKKMNLSGMN